MWFTKVLKNTYSYKNNILMDKRILKSFYGGGEKWGVVIVKLLKELLIKMMPCSIINKTNSIIIKIKIQKYKY